MMIVVVLQNQVEKKVFLATGDAARQAGCIERCKRRSTDPAQAWVGVRANTDRGHAAQWNHTLTIRESSSTVTRSLRRAGAKERDNTTPAKERDNTTPAKERDNTTPATGKRRRADMELMTQRQLDMSTKPPKIETTNANTTALKRNFPYSPVKNVVGVTGEAGARRRIRNRTRVPSAMRPSYRIA